MAKSYAHLVHLHSRRMRALYLILVCTFLSPYNHADVFRWQDALGNAHYSDRKPNQPEFQTIEFENQDDLYRVEKIFDGDTVLLEGGIRVRLAGINAPEVQHRKVPAEPGGEEAREWLRDLLNGQTVRLVRAVSARDHYGRTLGYIYLSDGRLINQVLLEKGLAVLSIYPPNVAKAPLFKQAQTRARAAELGVWGLPDYQLLAEANLNERKRNGWQRIAFIPERIKKTAKNLYLIAKSGFRVRIPAEYLHYFLNQGEEYLGKRVECQGWVQNRKSGLVMLVRHPSSLTPL